jgi:hypothetical protein
MGMKYREFIAAVEYLEVKNGVYPSFGMLLDFLSRMR